MSAGDFMDDCRRARRARIEEDFGARACRRVLRSHRQPQCRPERVPYAFARARVCPGRPHRRSNRARRNSAGARRCPHRHQGRAQHARHSHHLRLEDSRNLRPAVRCYSRRTPRPRRRRLPRQDELRRIRHGRLERKLRLRRGAESGRARPRSRRLERRLGSGCGSRPCRRVPGHGHGRLDSPAGRATAAFPA